MTLRAPEQTLLDATLSSAVRDQQFVSADGQQIRRLTEGVSVHRLPTHIDSRGAVTEIFDLRWGWHADPLVFAYMFTVRPGIVKGWGLHEHHEDRYAILEGEIELVLFDPRPHSLTYGEVCRIVLSGKDRSLVNIPTYVWHADHNIGSVDAVLVNFPTRPYDHANPDKYRLPIDTHLIPHSFGNARGG